MIRGALILGVGFALGYAKGLKDSEIIAEKINKAIDRFKVEIIKKDDVVEATASPIDTGTGAREAPETPKGDTTT